MKRERKKKIRTEFKAGLRSNEGSGGRIPRGRRGGRRWGTGIATVEVADDLARVGEVDATEPVAGELGWK